MDFDALNARKQATVVHDEETVEHAIAQAAVRIDLEVRRRP